MREEGVAVAGRPRRSMRGGSREDAGQVGGKGAVIKATILRRDIDVLRELLGHLAL